MRVALTPFPSRRAVTLAALVALVATTCAPSVATMVSEEAHSPRRGPRFVGSEEHEVRQAAAPTGPRLQPPALPSRSTVPRGGGASGAPEPPFEPVTVQQPKVRVEGLADDVGDAVAAASAVPGVSFATEVLLGHVELTAPPGPVVVRVAAVDPHGLRVLTPQVTADAVEVWERIVDGDAAFTHEVGHRLELALGARVPARGWGHLRVGAYASNGVPPIADLIVSREAAADAGMEGRRVVLLSITPDADAEQVASSAAAALGGTADVLEDPTPRRAFLTGAEARRAFEPFSFIDHGDGMITIDRDWVRRNIVRADVPVLRGTVVCHRLMVPQLRGALQAVEDRGLAHLIDTGDYGGCWVARHIDFNPSKPLSMHAWGIAVDLNVSTNGLGQRPQMDPRIVEIFEEWGFVWGGRWRRPDGMHFELGALLQNSRG